MQDTIEMSSDNITAYYEPEAEESLNDTLDIRITAVFVIFAAACLGGIPPLFIPVSDFAAFRPLAVSAALVHDPKYPRE